MTAVFLSLVACRQVETRREAPESTPPLALVEASDAVFTYVADRYDGNDDGVVTRDEYDRADADFDRLDRTSDGLLTADDFAPSGRRVRGIGKVDGRRLRGVHLVAWYLQQDLDRNRVDRAEVGDALRVYDRDGDGRVGRSEFEAIAEQRATFGVRPAGPRAGLLEAETTDPWGTLVVAIDGNDDGFVTAAELDAFYTRNESDWTFAPEHVVAPARSLLGLEAPDFTLPLSDRERHVTLSDFAGQRPVALIFGSYT